MKITTLISLAFLLSILFSACKEEVKEKIVKSTPKEKRESEKKFTERVQKAFAEIIDTSNVEGSILLFDFQKEKYYSNDLVWAEKEHLPASTFKIPNTIIGLETGAIQSDTSVFKWDGKPRSMKAWEKDLTLSEAFDVSCVPCYQQLARTIGYDKMKQYLNRFNYGAMEVTPKTLDKFWLEGNSKISQYQQIDFIERFYHDGLGVSEHTTNTMKKIMVMEETENYVLAGKTGWSFQNNIDNGWFVGYIEVGEKVYFFAVNVIPKEGFNINNFGEYRVNIARKALSEAGLMKE